MTVKEALKLVPKDIFKYHYNDEVFDIRVAVLGYFDDGEAEIPDEIYAEIDDMEDEEFVEIAQEVWPIWFEPCKKYYMRYREDF